MDQVKSNEQKVDYPFILNGKDIINADIKRFDKSVEIDKYDFKEPYELNKDILRNIEMMNDTFSRLSTTSLSAQLRTSVNMNIVSIEVVTYEEFINSIPSPTTLSVINMNPLNGSCVLNIDPSITFTIIDRLFGGTGDAVKIERELSDIELSMMEGIIVRLLGNLRESWGNVIDLRPRLGNIETNKRFTQIVSPDKMCVLINFKTRIGQIEGMINFCIPHITIMPIIPKFLPDYWYSSFRNKYCDDGNIDTENLSFDSYLYYEGESLSLNKLSNLSENDLIKLPDYKNGNAFLCFGDETIMRIKQGKHKREKNRDKPESVNVEENTDNIDENKNEINTIDKEISKIKSELGIINLRITDIINRENVLYPDVKPFDFIKRSDPLHLLNFIRQEHPQTIALILSYFDTAKAAKILSALPDDIQGDIAGRIAVMSIVSPEVLREIERVLERKLSTLASEDYTSSGGIDAVIAILNKVDDKSKKGIIEYFEKKEPKLLEEIRGNSIKKKSDKS